MRSYPAILSAIGAGLIVNGCSQTPETYAANCATPLENWGRESDGIGHLVMIRPIYLASDGSILWNNQLISDAMLARYMAQVSEFHPLPQVVLEVAPATACRRVEAVRAIINMAPICQSPRPRCSEGWNPEQWPEVGGP